MIYVSYPYNQGMFAQSGTVWRSWWKSERACCRTASKSRHKLPTCRSVFNHAAPFQAKCVRHLIWWFYSEFYEIWLPGRNHSPPRTNRWFSPCGLLLFCNMLHAQLILPLSIIHFYDVWVGAHAMTSISNASACCRSHDPAPRWVTPTCL